MNLNSEVPKSWALITLVAIIIGSALLLSFAFDSLSPLKNDILDYPPGIVGIRVEAPLMAGPPDETPIDTTVRVPVLVYHNIAPHNASDTKNQLTYTVTPDIFERQMQYLEDNGFQTIAPTDLVQAVKGLAKLPSKPVMLTFDDGWVNQYENAYGSLLRHRMIGVFYLFTNPIGRDRRFLTWEMASEMSDNGMIFGSHTVTHPYPEKEHDDDLARQFKDSKMALEAHLGMPVPDLSYPFGQSDERVKAAAADAGYVTARGLRHFQRFQADDLMDFGGHIVTDNFAAFQKIVDEP